MDTTTSLTNTAPRQPCHKLYGALHAAPAAPATRLPRSGESAAGHLLARSSSVNGSTLASRPRNSTTVFFPIAPYLLRLFACLATTNQPDTPFFSIRPNTRFSYNSGKTHETATERSYQENTVIYTTQKLGRNKKAEKGTHSMG